MLQWSRLSLWGAKSGRRFHLRRFLLCILCDFGLPSKDKVTIRVCLLCIKTQQSRPKVGRTKAEESLNTEISWPRLLVTWCTYVKRYGASGPSPPRPSSQARDAGRPSSGLTCSSRKSSPSSMYVCVTVCEMSRVAIFLKSQKCGLFEKFPGCKIVHAS